MLKRCLSSAQSLRRTRLMSSEPQARRCAGGRKARGPTRGRRCRSLTGSPRALVASLRPCRRLYSGSRSPAWRGWWTCPTPPARQEQGWDPRRRRRARGAPRARHACPPNAPCVSPSPPREDTAPAPQEPLQSVVGDAEEGHAPAVGGSAPTAAVTARTRRVLVEGAIVALMRGRGTLVVVYAAVHHRHADARVGREPCARRPVVSGLPFLATGSFCSLWQLKKMYEVPRDRCVNCVWKSSRRQR